MARSIADIKQQIIDAKNNEASLTTLNSPSTTAIWNLWAYVTAVAINLHEQLIDLFKAEIEDTASKVIPGTPIWLRQKVLDFQLGDQLQLINFAPVYATDKPEARIVAQCSVRQENNRVVLIKVAKRDINGNLGPLGLPFANLSDTLDNNSEINALKDYLDQIKFAGTATRVISLYPDQLQVYADIYYDGQFVKDTVKENVKQAIITYLNNLPFDGLFSNTRLVDAIQQVPGVTDIRIYSVKARNNQTAAEDAQTVYVTYPTQAGYIIMETDNNPDSHGNKHDFENTVTMILAS